MIIPVHKQVLTKNSEWFSRALGDESNWSENYPFYNDSELRVMTFSHLESTDDQSALVEFLQSFYAQWHTFIEPSSYVSMIYRHADYFNDIEGMNYLKHFIFKEMKNCFPIMAFRVDKQVFGKKAIETIIHDLHNSYNPSPAFWSGTDEEFDIITDRCYKIDDQIDLLNTYERIEDEIHQQSLLNKITTYQTSMNRTTYKSFLINFLKSVHKKMKGYKDDDEITLLPSQSFTKLIISVNFRLQCVKEKFRLFKNIMKIAEKLNPEPEDIGKIYQHLNVQKGASCKRFHCCGIENIGYKSYKYDSHKELDDDSDTSYYTRVMRGSYADQLELNDNDT